MHSSNQKTWVSLLHWDKGQTASERFAGDIIGVEGFQSIDPSHPLGGPDGLKDMALQKDGRRWIAASHFACGEKTFGKLKKKFADDFDGVAKNNAEGFVFITNQPLSITQRAKLEEIAAGTACEIYHLERLRLILDALRGVQIRQQYLGIPVSGEDLAAAVGQLDRFNEMFAAIASRALTEGPPRNILLELPASGDFSFAELARIAKEQGRPEMHRSYVIDQGLLPAFANLDHPVPPIILLDDFPADFADCYKTAHEVAMVLFFLQRCVGVAHMERLNQEERAQIVRVIERLWRRTVRLRPLVNKCQATLLLVGANRLVSSCAHLIVYMSAAHFLQEVLQATEQIGYTIASQALGEKNESDALPYAPEQIAAKWPEVVRSLRSNTTIYEGFRLLHDAFYDLSAEAVRAVRYEKGLPIIPAWMRVQGPMDAH